MSYYGQGISLESGAHQCHATCDMRHAPQDSWAYGHMDSSYQLLEVVARVGDFDRRKPKPAHHFLDGNEVFLLFCLGVRVVIPQIALAAMMSCEPEVDRNPRPARLVVSSEVDHKQI